MPSDEDREPSLDPEQVPTPHGLSIFTVVFYGGMTLLALALARAFGHPSLFRMEPSPPGPIPEWLGIALGIALGLATFLGSTYLRRKLGWTRGFHDEIRRMMGRPTTGQVALLAAASSIGEEALFRGALLPTIGLVPQALLFGLLHMGRGKAFRFWPFYAAAMGLALGLLYQASGSLLAPIVAHFTLNYFGLSSLDKKD